jgi:hypothetical protein
MIMKYQLTQHPLGKRVNNSDADKQLGSFLRDDFQTNLSDSQKCLSTNKKVCLSVRNLPPMPIIKTQEQTAGHVAQMLLQIEAIKLRTDNPFTWSSGWKSPIYCDNRLSLSYPEIRTAIKDGTCTGNSGEFFAYAEVIAGVATAGIPQGALVAEALNLTVCVCSAKTERSWHGESDRRAG